MPVGVHFWMVVGVKRMRFTISFSVSSGVLSQGARSHKSKYSKGRVLIIVVRVSYG